MKYFIFFILIATFLTSCQEMTEEIDWETKNIPSKAVVEGNIVTDSCYQRISLSTTADYFSNEKTPRISGAAVTVTDGITTYYFEESDTAKGVYYSTEMFKGIPDRTYTLNVTLPESLDGTSELIASEKLIQGFSIDSMNVYVFDNPYAAFTDDNEEDSTITVFYMIGNQPEDVVNYYFVQIFKNHIPVFKDITEMGLMSDEYAEDPNDTELFFYYMGDITSGDTMTIEVTSVSKEYYEYIRKLNELTIPPDVFGFSGPPADVLGNINNGKQLGYFYTGQRERHTSVAENGRNLKETIN